MWRKKKSVLCFLKYRNKIHSVPFPHCSLWTGHAWTVMAKNSVKKKCGLEFIYYTVSDLKNFEDIFMLEFSFWSVYVWTVAHNFTKLKQKSSFIVLKSCLNIYPPTLASLRFIFNKDVMFVLAFFGLIFCMWSACRTKMAVEKKKVRQVEQESSHA